MFKLKFETDGEDFNPMPGIEVSRILQHIADNMYRGPFDTEGSVQDMNGNIIGHYKLTKD